MWFSRNEFFWISHVAFWLRNNLRSCEKVWRTKQELVLGLSRQFRFPKNKKLNILFGCINRYNNLTLFPIQWISQTVTFVAPNSTDFLPFNPANIRFTRKTDSCNSTFIWTSWNWASKLGSLWRLKGKVGGKIRAEGRCKHRRLLILFCSAKLV